MPSGNPNIAEAGKNNQWGPGQSGNPKGKPKGARHLRTIVQELLADENFEQKLKNGQTIKGVPLEAIVKVGIAKAMSGDKGWFDALSKYAIGTRMDIDQKLEMSGDINITFESNDKE
jgi:hypothetical protein